MSDQVQPSPLAVGFPPPLLGPEPQRLPVLVDSPDWLALEKPAGAGTRAHPWDAEVPDLDTALNAQLQAGKPELQRLGAELFGSVYYLDPEIAGVALFAKNRDALADLRNRFGSGEGRFHFHFVSAAAGNGPAEPLEADAPLLPHRVKPKMIPSTARGKKCRTTFRPLAASDGWVLWEAGCDFFRPHQVRAHAAVSGLPVLGDSLYDGPPIPLLRELGGRRRGSGKGLDKPAYPGLPIRLVRACPGVDLPEVEAAADKAFALLLRRLGLRGEGGMRDET